MTEAYEQIGRLEGLITQRIAPRLRPGQGVHWVIPTRYDGRRRLDQDAVHHRVPALKAGLDLEMPGTGGVTDAEVVAAVRAGELDESVVDAAARRVLRLVGRAHSGVRLSPEQLDLLRTNEHHALAREAAAACVTLLRNEPAGSAPALPLAEDCSQRIAVVGAFAANGRVQGGGSSGVNPTRVDVALDALREIAGDRIVYAPGYVHTPLDHYQDDLTAHLTAHEIPDDGADLPDAAVRRPPGLREGHPGSGHLRARHLRAGEPRLRLLGRRRRSG